MVLQVGLEGVDILHAGLSINLIQLAQQVQSRNAEVEQGPYHTDKHLTQNHPKSIKSLCPLVKF